MSTHKAAAGVKAQHKSRPGKRLGIKVYADQKVKKGQILVRQRGVKIKPGDGIGIGRDFTLYATKDGKLAFKKFHDQQTILIK